MANCPYPHLRDPARALALAKIEVEKSPKSVNWWTGLGMASYRMGDWKGSVAALEKAESLGGHGFTYSFLAMAHWQLGNKDQAQHWYQRAVEDSKKKNYLRTADVERIRAETAALLKIDDRSKEKPE